MNPLRLVPNESHDPFYNQALEEVLFEEGTQDTAFVWRNEPSVICGRNQNVFCEVCLPKAQERGVHLVRRMSGGGTVYHDLGNINYSILQKSESIEVDYPRFLRPMCQVLASFGLHATILMGNGLALGPHKISGNAQRMAKGRVMHHGTLLFSTDLSALHELADGQRMHYASKATPSAPHPVTNIKDHLSEDLSVEEFFERLLAAMDRVFSFEREAVRPEEERRAQELLARKYRTFEWTFGKSPAFSFRREVLFQGRQFLIAYEAKKGRIVSMAPLKDYPGLADALLGQRLDLVSLEAFLSVRFGLYGLSQLFF
ncbi:Lipoate-protein ligase A [Clostridiaceae bacterium JG1575]|nr:Lipoate-protein ligase A [Clostridiaceae bacterium JG1575]